MRCYDRLTQAVSRRPVELAQYASGDYQAVLAAEGIVCSMSRRGNCWDNAVAESFFATLKVELVHDAAARRLHVGQDEDAAHDLFRRLRPRFSRRRLIRMR
jgi:transposase InsO family protein